MTQEESRTSSNSKFLKILLVVVAAFCTFGGPYLVYVLTAALDLSFFVAFAAGFALFFIGLFLVWYLIRAKIIV
jgi:hypothetical protein